MRTIWSHGSEVSSSIENATESPSCRARSAGCQRDRIAILIEYVE
jgi:hypothetical protein